MRMVALSVMKMAAWKVQMKAATMAFWMAEHMDGLKVVWLAANSEMSMVYMTAG